MTTGRRSTLADLEQVLWPREDASGLKPFMTPAEAARYVPFSEAYLRRCIRSLYPTPQRPALRAKVDGEGRYLIRAADLLEWVDAHPDA